MTRLLFTLVFLLGLMAVIWIGLGFRESDLLALSVTVLIGTVYGLGFLELGYFRRGTQALNTQLGSLPQSREALAPWIADLPPALQNAVRRRIEGEPVALPGPLLTPYLAGLLVMLGLLGTFVGMIVTLDGAATALNGSSELTAIRSALAAPIQGLSLAFGTSIAGVAASAMLGLASTLCRRERVLLSRQLDQRIRHDLHHLTLNHHREQAFNALQEQSRALPELVSAMQAMTSRIEQMSEQVATTLTRNQSDFHTAVSGQYQELAQSVAQSLQDNLRDSSRLAAEGIKPIMEQAMARLSEQASSTHQHLNTITEQQLATLAGRFQRTTEQAAQHWQQGLDRQQQASIAFADEVRTSLSTYNQEFQQGAQTLLEQIGLAHEQLNDRTAERLAEVADGFRSATEQAASSWQKGLGEHQQASAELASEISTTLQAHNEAFQRSTSELLSGQCTGLEELVGVIGEQLSNLHAQEIRNGEAATARLAALEATVTDHLARLGNALETPMTRLIETASETPKAAAEVITQLREEMARNSERDNELLDERRRIMTELDALLSSQREAATAQREAIETLVRSTSETLGNASDTFSVQVNEQGNRLTEVAAEVTGSAQEIASLSDAFNLAVRLFSESNDKLVGSLQQVETSLANSAARNDEQLAYYVEQAREVIELSMSSQKDVIDALAALKGKGVNQSAASVT